MTIQFNARIGTETHDNLAAPSASPQNVQLTAINGTTFGMVPGTVTVTANGVSTPAVVAAGGWTAGQITCQAAFPAPGPWQITVSDGVPMVNADSGSVTVAPTTGPVGTLAFTARVGMATADDVAAPAATPQDVRITAIDGTTFGTVQGSVTVTANGVSTPAVIAPGGWTSTQITCQAAFVAPGPWQLTVSSGVSGVKGHSGSITISPEGSTPPPSDPWQAAVNALASTLHLHLPLGAGTSNAPLTPILAQVVQVAAGAPLPSTDQVLDAISTLLPVPSPTGTGTPVNARLQVRWLVSPEPTPPATGDGDPALIDTGTLGDSGVQAVIRPLPLSTYTASGDPAVNAGDDTRYLHAIITFTAAGHPDVPVTLTAGPINVPKLPIVPLFALWRGPEFASNTFLENHAWPAGPGQDDSAVYIALPTAQQLADGTLGPFTNLNGGADLLTNSAFGQLANGLLGGTPVSFGSLLNNQPSGLDQLFHLPNVDALPAAAKNLLAYAQGLRQLVTSVGALIVKGGADPHTYCTVQGTRELDGPENVYIINKGGLDALKLEDNTQSAMLFGPPGTTVDVYVLPQKDDGKGHAVISTGSGYVASIPRFGDIGPDVTATPVGGEFVPAAPVAGLPAGDIKVVHAIQNDRGAFATQAAHGGENSLAKTITSFEVHVGADVTAAPMTPSMPMMKGGKHPMPMPTQMGEPAGGDPMGIAKHLEQKPVTTAEPYPMPPVGIPTTLPPRPSVIGVTKEQKK